ncbi:MAG: hypothetical protein GEV07_30185 [Streptosporangiales bacterium]|nr:hypothetical protein [Streptosporangiales bacterium]
MGGGIANAAEPSEPSQQPAQLGQALPGLPDPTAVVEDTLGNPLGSDNARAAEPAAAPEQSTPQSRTHAEPVRNTTDRPNAKPARPVHAGVAVPIETADNAIGTPLGQVDVPAVTNEVNTRDVTDPAQDVAAPVTAAGAPVQATAAPATAVVNDVTDTVNAATRYNDKEQHTPFTRPERTTGAPPADDPFLGNRVNADLVVPVQIAGNAIAAGGPASVDGSSSNQSYDGSQDITTGGAGIPLAGNVVDADWAVPVQIAGNALAGAGTAETTGGHAGQDVVLGGDDTTDGRDGFLSGNVATGQWATPVQLTGNAVSGAGTADVVGSRAVTNATSGGAVDTAGSDSFGSGNVGAVPLGLPAELNGNAPTVLGTSDSAADSEAYVTAGGTKPGVRGRQTYVQTDGDSALLGGNVAQPQGAMVANVASVAGALGGAATTGGATSPIADPFALPTLVGGSALRSTSMHTIWPPLAATASRTQDRLAGSTSSSTNDVTSGGYTTTSGRNGTGSGNVADAPVSAPAEAFAAGGTLVGAADAAHDQATDTTAGSKTFTNGSGSTLSGNTASSPLSGTAEAFGGGVGAIGDASGTATETKDVESGGYNGTLGNDSLASGNLAQTPLAVPGEVFGVGAGGIGSGVGSATETKNVEAGGTGNTDDDNGTISSNLAAVPVALPAQAFGIGAGGVGTGIGAADADTTTTAGHDYKATGVLGTIAGNIAQAPVSFPAQVHGLGGSAIGDGYGFSTNLTEATAGGNNLSDGRGGALTGNVVHTPSAGTGNVFGLAASGLGESSADVLNGVSSTAGGETTSAGDEGTLAGNVVGAETLPIAQAANAAATALAESSAYGIDFTDATSGGDITSSGATGTLAGYVLDVPTVTPARAFDDTASVLGGSYSGGHNQLAGNSGGTVVTDAGGIGQLPLAPSAQVYDLQAGILGEAVATATEFTELNVGEHPLSLDAPVDLS